MCGIAGFYGDFKNSLLAKMNLAIAQRGPDDRGEIILHTDQDKIGLAHRRLSILDLTSAGKQPLTVDCACCGKDAANNHRLWLTYNGEIYNYKELKERLIKKGHHFKSETDSEVLLHLYVEYGHGMLDLLNGIFAFAIYDGRKGQQFTELFLARDPMGVKPLYYAETKQGFLFSSELKALLENNDMSLEINPSAVSRYISYLWSPGADTMLSSVKKVLPGEFLIVKHGCIQKKIQFSDVNYSKKHYQASKQNITEALSVQVENSVGQQLMSDAPVGAFLSGGLDSSAIVAMMRRRNPNKKIDCFTIGLSHMENKEGFPEDLVYARSVAKHLNLDLHEVQVDSGIMEQLPKMLYYMDEPQADPAPLNVLAISKAAKQMGIKVLMSGAGGDDIFSGYRRHRALQFDPVWQYLPLAIRKSIAKFARKIISGENKVINQQSAFLRRLLKMLSYIDYPQHERLVKQFYWGEESLLASLFNKSFIRQFSFSETVMSPMLNSLSEVKNEKSLLNQLLYLETKHFLADHNLNYTDKMGMAVGVEIRVPLLDLKLVDFAAKIPPKYKQHGKHGKYIFKKAMEPYLPKKVIYRKKTGFGVPLRTWVKGDLLPMISDVLSKEALSSRGIFNYESIQRLINLNNKNKIDGSYTLFSVLCIELWCQIFVDKQYSLFPF